MMSGCDGAKILERKGEVFMNANKLSLCQHFFEKKESLLVCSECSLSLDLDAVHNSNKIRGNKKITTDEELYLAAHAYLDVMAKAKHAAPLVVNESNVRISGQMLEDMGVVGAKASRSHCYHWYAAWNDDKKIVVCKNCGIDLAEVYGCRHRRAKEDYAQECAARDGLTKDNRRPRVDLRTDAQIAHDRAVQRLQQHKRARWGMADSVDWDEQS